MRGDFSIRFYQTSKNYPSWSVLTKSPGKLVQNVLNTYLVSINKISWENGSKQLEPISQQILTLSNQVRTDKICWEFGSKCLDMIEIDEQNIQRRKFVRN